MPYTFLHVAEWLCCVYPHSCFIYRIRPFFCLFTNLFPRGSAMNRILAVRQLSAEVFQYEIEAPLIAQERKPGQFVILQIDTEFGERIPLTISDADPAKGTISLIFQTVGASTHKLALKKPGDSIEAILGPLGKPTHIENFGTVVCVGGGVGIAPLHPIVEGLKKAGDRIITLL